MKVIKMRIHRWNPAPGHTKYAYPHGFNSSKIVMGPWYDPEAKGKDWEEIIFGVRDEDLDEFLAFDGAAAPEPTANGFIFSAEEVTREWAEVEVRSRLRDEEFELGAEFIQDPAKVAKILAKISRGENLTDEELLALNPDDPADGISRKRSVKDHWDEKFSIF